MGTVSILTLAQSPSTTNMKFLVLFACVVAAASAQLVAYPNGAVAPAKTPEVQAAKAAHFAAKGLPWGAYGAYGLGHLGYAGHLGYGAGYAGHLGYAPDTDMLDTQDMPVTDMQDTHGVSLPTPTVPQYQLNPLMLLLPVPPTWLPMVPHLLDQLAQLPHTTLKESKVSLLTPTVPSSQLNPLMSSLPAPNTWLPMLKKRAI